MPLIYCLNFPVFPSWIPRVGQSLEQQRVRVDRLVATLYQLDVLPDLVALQEVWSEFARARLTQALEADFPFHVTDQGRACRCTGLGTGLLLFSRVALQDVAVHQFASAAGDDSGAVKGLISAQLEPDVRLLVTHLQSVPTPSFGCWRRALGCLFRGTCQNQALEVNEEQLGELHGWLAFYDQPTLLLGDFNAPVQRLRRVFRTCEVLPGDGNYGQRVDHVVSAGMGAYAPWVWRMPGDRLLSDHDPLCVWWGNAVR